MSGFKKENCKKYFNEITNYLDEYSYRHKRYHINFAIAIVYCPDSDLNPDLHFKAKRKTDKYISLQSNLFFVVFDCIDSNSSKIATQNLENSLKESCTDREFFIHSISSTEYENSSNMLETLFRTLENSFCTKDKKSSTPNHLV